MQDIYNDMKDEQDLYSYENDRDSPSEAELPEWEQTLARWAKR